MSSQTIPKMSLEAMYDDLCRYTKVLTAGSEKEFIMFADGQKNLIRKLKEDSAVIDQLRTEVNKLKDDKRRHELQMTHMKNLLEQETERRRKMAEEKNSMEQQIALIKDVLEKDGKDIDNHTKEQFFQISNNITRQRAESQAKLTTIEESYGSLLSPEDFDESGDELTVNVSRRQKRRSKSGRRSSGDRSQKKKKSEEMETLSEDIEEAFNIDLDNRPVKKGVNFRSSSEPNTNTPEVPTPRPVHRSDSDQVKSCTYDLRAQKYRTLSSGNLPGNTPTGRYSTGGKLSRSHAFTSKTVIRTEKCYPCGKVIKFCKMALRCTDCRISCHPECKDQCPLPCIPCTFTPTKGIVGTLADYTSSTPPMIPSLIVQCVNAIESKETKEIGPYRVSGSEREVKDLKDKLLRRQNISLNNIHVNVLCGTIKDFLRSLKDSIISRMMWHTFVDAADKEENVSLNLLCNAVFELPQPNKETLAFLILHLQRIANEPEYKMPIVNLAKVFGPTIVGYSSKEPSDSNILTETTQQEQVMRRLLSIPADFWQNLLSLDVPEVFHPHTKTPEITPAPVASRLGPIYASGHKPKNVQIGRTPLTPRNTKYSTKTGRRQFFTSPLTK